MKQRWILSVVKTYALAAFIAAMFAAVFIYFVINPKSWSQSPGSYQSSDCLPGYNEIYFGQGAYACQRAPAGPQK